jgi:hypothetical protein
LNVTTCLDISLEEIVYLFDQHTRTVQVWLSTRSPQAFRYDGLGVAVSSIGLAVRLLNPAHGGSYPLGNPLWEIEAEIEKVKGIFAKRGVPWYWWVGPDTQPPDLFQLLTIHGLVNSYSLPAIVAPLTGSRPPLNPTVKVWQAETESDLSVASMIKRKAFGFPASIGLTYFEDMAADWLKGDPARLYLARTNDGPPAAIGALIMGADYPGVFVMATLPEWGRRGLGGGILVRMFSQAAEEGHRLIALTAGRKGHPLYRKSGFERVFDYHVAWCEDQER